jgi:hypothetical protein
VSSGPTTPSARVDTGADLALESRLRIAVAHGGLHGLSTTNAQSSFVAGLQRDLSVVDALLAAMNDHLVQYRGDDAAAMARMAGSRGLV